MSKGMRWARNFIVYGLCSVPMVFSYLVYAISLGEKNYPAYILLTLVSMFCFYLGITIMTRDLEWEVKRLEEENWHLKHCTK
jgi:hypothetical protein